MMPCRWRPALTGNLDSTAVTIHRDFYTADDNHLDLRYPLFAAMQDGKMAEVWEVPFDQAENDRYLAVQARSEPDEQPGGPGADR
jgi:hypothetical protein